MTRLDALLDQLPFVVAFGVATGLLLLVVHLGVSPLTWGTAGYVLLLAAVALAAVLLVDLLRKASFRRELARRLESGPARLEAPLPRPASREQRAYAELLDKTQAAAARETAALRRRSDEHRAFVDMWVHQMKTPVNVLQLAARRRDAAAWPDVAQEVERLSQGLDLMLAAARLERFELDLALAEIDLVAAVRSALNDLSSYFISAGTFPKLSAEADVTAVTDPKWLQIVLRQLLTNAAKYAPAGSYVSVRVEREPDGALVAVKDEGPGIPAEDLPRVFDRFFTGANGRAYGASTGMGLHVAAEVCRRMGHELTVESSPGGGTTASVRLREAGVHRAAGRSAAEVTGS